jgi:hypothetical protein
MHSGCKHVLNCMRDGVTYISSSFPVASNLYGLRTGINFDSIGLGSAHLVAGAGPWIHLAHWAVSFNGGHNDYAISMDSSQSS